ncbi:MAG TPA: hypothetical protein VKE74_14535 [Gemmataceae bacterium]|nr:hypothetical protein [Gemmataceae bacterium]
MFKTPTLLVVGGLIAGGALLNGAATQRWSAFAPDPARTDSLHAAEIRFDDWQPAEVPTEMPTNERSIATSRRYTSASTGRTAVVTFISGVPGSVSTHTPDVCYPGSGYRTLHAPRRENLELPGGRTGVCYVADFEKKKATRVDRVRVRWAWTTDGTWVAPDNPRWQFARQLAAAPVLYKVYVATTLPDAPENPTERTEDDAITKAFVTAVWTQYAAAFGQ